MCFNFCWHLCTHFIFRSHFSFSIFMTVVFCYSVLLFVPLWQKGGVIFIFGPGMNFQTGQVIFVPEWPKGEFVSILASFCVWTKSLMCKRCCKQGFQLTEHFQKTLHCEKLEDFRFPVSRPDEVSSRPDNVFILTGRQTDQHHPSGRRIFSVRTLHCIEKLMFQYASVQTSQQPIRTPISTRTVSDSFQVPIKGRSINRPDDVVSRPDACFLKARIAIQISPSGRQSALVRTRAQQLRKLPIRLLPSGRLPLMVRTHA